ncbi:MAG: thiazole synthase, partial [Planctomycetota bacterium]|nr:thiazole synthase [Planctomycetota bacterium]
MNKGRLVVAGKEFGSRLFVGTGKFSSSAAMRASIEASGSEMVTVALRRVDIANPEDDVLSALDRKKVQLLPNTSGARDAKEAVRVARLAREASGV